MNKQLSYVLYVLLGIVLAALLMMTIVASAGGKAWGGMMTILVLSLLGLAIAVSVVAFNPRKGAYSIGFYLSHIGIVMFLVGCLVYTIGGHSVTVAVPADTPSTCPSITIATLVSELSHSTVESPV